MKDFDELKIFKEVIEESFILIVIEAEKGVMIG